MPTIRICGGIVRGEHGGKEERQARNMVSYRETLEDRAAEHVRICRRIAQKVCVEGH